MDEHDIVDHAVRALTESLSVSLEDISYSPYEPATPRSEPDGKMTVRVGGHESEFEVEVRGGVNEANAFSVGDRRPALGNDLLVIAKRIRPSVARVLRQRGVGYLDLAGNAHIESGPLLIHIEGRMWKAPESPIRAFNGEGLRVIFVLLLDAVLASEPYRTLSDLSGASHGVVQYTMDDLVRLDYVVRTGHTQRRVTDADAMLDRWAQGYAEALRPKLSEGEFAFSGAGERDLVREWRSITLDAEEDLWGGEPAAALKTDHLRPGRLTVYTRSGQTALMKRLRVAPRRGGPLRVVQTFWPLQIEQAVPSAFDGETVPDVVAYADLLSTGDPRNAEVASVLRDRILLGHRRG